MLAGTILIDLYEAFDYIPHGLLVAKMRAYMVLVKMSVSL